MKKKEIKDSSKVLLTKIYDLLSESRKYVAKSINLTLVNTYFELGRLIVEDEQNGKYRANYGMTTLKDLSSKLTEKFGKGFSVQNLERMRRFFLIYKGRIGETGKSSTVSGIFNDSFKLSWSHYALLLKIQERNEREFYEIEASNCNWSVRELERQFSTSLYERLLLSTNWNSFWLS